MTVFVAVSSCTIAIISGPSTVAVGEIVTYVLDLGSDAGGGNNITLYVIADVPAGWNLVSSTFDGTVNGVPMSGPGTVVASTVCDTPAVLPGFQRLHISVGPLAETAGGDTGTATLEFEVDSQPAGQYQIYFRFGGSSPSGGSCSTHVARTINRGGIDFLTFLAALFDGVDGVDGLFVASSATVTADGRHVLATAAGDNSLAVFSRDTVTGELAFLEALVDGVGGVDGLWGASAVAVSPDGLHAYATAASDSALAVFSRDVVTGRLTFVEALFDNVGGVNGLESANGVAVSPDGDSVYTTSYENAVGVFSRDETTGELTFLEVLFDGVGGIDSLAGANSVAVSPDGMYVYVSAESDDALTVFSRDQLSGELTFVEALIHGQGGVQGLIGVNSLAITADGRHLYTSAWLVSSVAVFARDGATGELTFVEWLTDHGVFGLELPRSVAISPSGSHVFTAGENSVVVFDRNAATGELTFVEAQFDDDPPNQGLGGARSVAVAADGCYLYVASADDHALAAFRTAQIFADGFESGGTSRWSTTTP